MLDEHLGEEEGGELDIGPTRSLLESRRSILGLAPLPLEGQRAVEAAIAARTPAGVRFENLLAIGEELGARVLPTDDFDRWATACQRLDAMAYALRLLEAQVIAGNTGAGLLLPDRDLLV